ncbi:MAG TPA: bifunctional DNA-formamidopyrimidine glycosylase/DNA-(apurinic or apyrimidinic site) lyase [Terracidiphilus sp.]|nr:bifunctional DNA-formamidopyrimidine glycosylase/DNA-(apurinic or apyrimidinic site) lyase [Terracidiphilus sp.]
MPELPEVETIARGVDARLRGDVIAEAWFGRHREPMKTPAARQAAGLEGRVILAVHRTGKHIVVDLGPAGGGALNRGGGCIDAQWIVHLGMTGRLLVTVPEGEVAPHTHARLTLNSGRELRFVDPRRFGRLEFRELRQKEGFLAPGADPLRIGEAEFAALLRGRKLAIKAALLNQTLLAGVGNIYADESLFRAGIRPRRSAGRLTSVERERLRVALREVLRQAIRLGGSSVSDYVDANGVKGFFQLEHRVYRRTGEPCRECGTAIRRVVVAGRSTHYCPQCQR